MLDERHLQHQIAEEQLQHFNEQGYLTVENALPDDLVQALERRVDRIHQEHLESGWDPYTNSALTPHKNFFYPNFLGRDQLFVNLLDWYKVFPKVWGILGWNIYSYHSHLIITPPRPVDADRTPKPLGWHQDSGRVNVEMESSPRPRLSLKVVYWLSDCSEPGRGNFYILPGSHLHDKLERPSDGSLPEGAIAVCCKPGDAVFFDRRLWHARSENDSDITRKGLFYGYGYRWLRSKDDLTIPEEILKNNDPIRQQLLGGGTNANGHFSPRDADVPLKVWLTEHGVIPK
jgi:ectoine hydroxylase-related dioxygenase (phytanoyl-CoA dioxygenase family)